MAWKYSALQEKLTSIQAQLIVKMDKSNGADQVTPVNGANNCLHDNQDLKTVALKRKAEDSFINNVDNSKVLRSSCLMLDMYTQTDATAEVQMKQIHDLVKKNSEHIRSVEDMVTKLCNIIGAFADGGSSQVVSMSCQDKKSSDSSPVDARTQLTQYQGVSNSNLSPNDYVTQVPQQNIIGSWDGSQIRSDDLTMSTSISESENGLNEETTASVKSPAGKQENVKVNWGCDSASLPGDQPPSNGCWLGDPNDVNGRAWFSGDPKIILKCESYGRNPVKLALAMTEALFTREEMAASNVRGTRGKDTLDPSKIKAIKAHVDYKFPLEEDRMEIRWQLLKPKLDSKCRSQRRLQREHKWKMEKLLTEKPEISNTPRPKRLVIGDQEREILLYGASKSVVSVYTESNTDATSFPEAQEGYLPVNTNE